MAECNVSLWIRLPLSRMKDNTQERPPDSKTEPGNLKKHEINYEFYDTKYGKYVVIMTLKMQNYDINLAIFYRFSKFSSNIIIITIDKDLIKLEGKNVKKV